MEYPGDRPGNRTRFPVCLAFDPTPVPSLRSRDQLPAKYPPTMDDTMRKRVPSIGFRACLALLAILVAVPVLAQPRTEIRISDSSSELVAIPADNVAALLRQGQQLEQQRRWGEALAHYENAIRQYPERGRVAAAVRHRPAPLRPRTPLHRPKFLRRRSPGCRPAGVGPLRPGVVEDRLALCRGAAMARSCSIGERATWNWR